MYEIFVDNVCVHNDQPMDKNRKVLNPKLTLSDNAAGSLTFTMPSMNIAYDTTKRMISRVAVKKKGTEIWSGRIIDEQEDFWKQRTITCEGELAYLCDTTQPVVKYRMEHVDKTLPALIDIDVRKYYATKFIDHTYENLDQLSDIPVEQDPIACQEWVPYILDSIGYSVIGYVTHHETDHNWEWYENPTNPDDGNPYVRSYPLTAYGYVQKMYKFNTTDRVVDVINLIDGYYWNDSGDPPQYSANYYAPSTETATVDKIVPSQSLIEEKRNQGYLTGLELIDYLCSSIIQGYYTLNKLKADFTPSYYPTYYTEDDHCYNFYGWVRAKLRMSGYEIYGDDQIRLYDNEYFYEEDGYERHYTNTINAVKIFLETIISNHNSKVSNDKKFTVGTVSVTDPNNYLYKITNHNTTWECIKEKLIDSYGGHIVIRKENGVRYLDYIKDYNGENPQTIEFGENLLDYTKDWDLTNLSTVILPLGASTGETPDGLITLYTTVESVNNNSPYVISEDAKSTYGWIEKVISWDDVTTPANLLKKAQTYLEEIQFESLSIEISAVDLNVIDPDIGEFKLLDTVRVISKPHGMNKTFPITKISIPLDKPDEASYVIGLTERPGLTDMVNK